MQLKYCVSFMNSRKVSKSPDRLPRSMSQAFGGEETFTNSMCLPPMISSRSGLRGVIVKVSGARATISITKSSSIRTLVPFTMHPAFFRCSTALGVQEFDPDVAQDAHRSLVDTLHAIRIQRLGRSIRVHRDPPWHLVDRRRPRADLHPCPSSGVSPGWFIGHCQRSPVLCSRMTEPAPEWTPRLRRKQVVFGISTEVRP